MEADARREQDLQRERERDRLAAQHREEVYNPEQPLTTLPEITLITLLTLGSGSFTRAGGRADETGGAEEPRA